MGLVEAVVPASHVELLALGAGGDGEVTHLDALQLYVWPLEAIKLLKSLQNVFLHVVSKLLHMLLSHASQEVILANLTFLQPFGT